MRFLMPSRSQQHRSARLVAWAPLGALACAALACSRTEPAPRPAHGPLITAPLATAGRLTLTGVLSDAAEGAVVVQLVETHSGRVLLRRTYDLADPAWDRRHMSQALYFAIDERDALDVEPPVHAPLVCEAAYVQPSRAALPGPDGPRVSATFERLTSELDLELHSEAAVAGATTPR